MGSPSDEPGRRDDEGPVHTVTISRPFYLAARETTVRQFRVFVEQMHYTPEAGEMGEGALEWDYSQQTWKPRHESRWNNPGFSQDVNDPVVCVSRHDAEVFCYWLSKKENRTYRLPTEAEWEYACRAGTTTAYATGPTLAPDQARFGANLQNPSEREVQRPLQTEKVGAFAPNALGLFDMHGNVWEWCADIYGRTAYRDGPSREPIAPKASDMSVVRGGSWQSNAADCRSARRLPLAPSTRRNDVGFRVLLEAGVR